MTLIKAIDHDDPDSLIQLLVGRTVTKVSDRTLELDDGRILKIVPNDGGCICGAGDYELTELNECPVNAIMAVDVIEAPTDTYSAMSYSLFVLAADRRIRLWQIDGDDGNGYYGTGYRVQVFAPGTTDEEIDDAPRWAS